MAFQVQFDWGGERCYWKLAAHLAMEYCSRAFELAELLLVLQKVQDRNTKIRRLSLQEIMKQRLNS